MKRWIYWLKKSIRSREFCGKFCVTCPHFEVCKEDIQL